METLQQRAREFATKAHAGQQRKYTGTPYVVHPIRVAERVAERPDATQEMVAAAYLHDVVEDCGITLLEIETAFGRDVARIVDGLTNKTKGMTASRAERKRLDRLHLSKQPKAVKIIKLIDRVDNLREMGGADGGFKAKYAAESLLLADVVGDADAELRTQLIDLANELARKE
jgi:(p)ppGpp synthase/HD superfamily hydrolase